jgi:hypothetical protein
MENSPLLRNLAGKKLNERINEFRNGEAELTKMEHQRFCH